MKTFGIAVLGVIVVGVLAYIFTHPARTVKTYGPGISSSVSSARVDQSVVGTYKSWGPVIVLENDGRVYGDCFYPRSGFVTWSLNGNIVSVQVDGRVTTLRIASDGRSLILREGNSDLVFIKQ